MKNPELRNALLQELLATYQDPSAEGALADFVAALHGGVKLGRNVGRVAESLTPPQEPRKSIRKAISDPDLILRVVSEAGDWLSPAEMIAEASKISKDIKPPSLRATYNRLLTEGKLERKGDGNGGYVYRLGKAAKPNRQSRQARPRRKREPQQ